MDQKRFLSTTLTLDDVFKLVEGPVGSYYMVQRTPEEIRKRKLDALVERRKVLQSELGSIHEQLDELDDQIGDTVLDGDEE